MSRISDYVERLKQDWREKHFKEHVATLLVSVDQPIIVLNWQKPGTWNYGCRFIIHRRWLCVVGDIGEATYEWGQDITLDFLAGLDFGYFAGKCRASERGSKYEAWDRGIANLHRQDRIKELIARAEDDAGVDDKREIELLEGLGCSEEDEYKSAGQDFYDESGDAEGAGDIATMGIVPDGRCIGHFVGLQMAIAQLKANNQIA